MPTIRRDTVIFHKNNFLFKYAWGEQIGAIQWSNKDNTVALSVFVGYRAFVFLYWLFWFTLECIKNEGEGSAFVIYLTRWGALAEVVYFACALAVALIPMFSRGQRSSYLEITDPEYDVPIDQWDGKPKWYLTGLWIFTNIMQVSALAIAVLYWTILVQKMPGNVSSALNIHMHGINALLMLIDLFIVSTPCRLLHFWTTTIVALVYALFTVIFFAADGTNAEGNHYIYWVLDFKNYPGFTTLIEIILVFIMAPLFHVIIYGLYRLRLCLFESLESWSERRITLTNSKILFSQVSKYSALSDKDGSTLVWT